MSPLQCPSREPRLTVPYWTLLFPNVPFERNNPSPTLDTFDVCGVSNYQRNCSVQSIRRAWRSIHQCWGRMHFQRKSPGPYNKLGICKHYVTQDYVSEHYTYSDGQVTICWEKGIEPFKKDTWCLPQRCGSRKNYQVYLMVHGSM